MSHRRALGRLAAAVTLAAAAAGTEVQAHATQPSTGTPG